MAERVLLTATMNQFGKTVIELTNHLSKETFWTHSSEHFLSVIGQYIFNVEYIEKGDYPVGFDRLVDEAILFLEANNDWTTLSEKLHNSPYLDLQNDALFHKETDGIWEESNLNFQVRQITLVESLTRLKYLSNGALKE